MKSEEFATAMKKEKDLFESGMTAISAPPQSFSRKREGNVSAKWLPNGKLRFFTNDARKSGCAELQCCPASGIADTIITAHPLNVIIWYED